MSSPSPQGERMPASSPQRWHDRRLLPRRPSRAGVCSIVCSIVALLAGAPSARAAAPPADPLAGVARIVFLGDSITHSGQYVDEVEAELLLAYPGRRFEVISVGLSSETVSGLSEVGHAKGKFPRP